MTTIRRITVSQINGNDANSTDTNEIRPFGETAFYLDTSGQTDKLTLMMFDGVRTHQKSKVLSPGELFGSNADSGDNNGYDTIKLIPDATLKANGSDQYLIVDPTGPNHIHIRAGGPQDDSGTQLYIGGENSYFRVNDGVNPNLYIAANSSVWTFDGNGVLTIPSGEGTEYTIGESEPGMVFESTLGFGFLANSNGDAQILTFNNQGLLQSSGNLQLRSAGIEADYTATASGTIINVPLNAAGDTVDYTGGASLIEVPTNADTNQVQAGWIITFNGGARRTVSSVGVAGGYTSIYYSEASPGGTLYPLTIESSNYVAQNDGNVYITPNIDNNASPTWTFANSGLTTIPGSLLSSTGSISFIANSSGDGNGYSTIEINPDITLNTDQYLVIDPTAGPGGGHIHIRAGGTQDASTTELYLGGENSYFMVGSGSNPTVYVSANSNAWTFSGNGEMISPDGFNIAPLDLFAPAVGTRLYQAVNEGLEFISSGNLGGQTSVGWIEDTSGPSNIAAIGFNSLTAEGVNIVTGNFSTTAYVWSFDNTGDLTLPSGGSIIMDSSSSSTIDGVTSITFADNTTMTTASVGSSYGDSNVATLLGSFGSNTISTTGNANVGNLGTGTVIATTGNITTVNSGLMQNGNSNVTVTANSNVAVSVAGNANVLVVTGTGANIAGTANVTGNANVGNLGVTGNLRLGAVGSNIVLNNSATIFGDEGLLGRSGSIVLSPYTGAGSTFPSVIIGGAGRLAAPNGSVHLIFNTNDLTYQVQLKSTVSTAATSTTTGSFVTPGGVGIGGNLYVGGTATTGVNALVAGATNTLLPNTVASFTSNVNNYTQVTFQNKSNGADATADFILTADNGSDTVNYADFGIINSGYDNATPTNSLGNIVAAGDSYLYAQGNVANTSQSGGNLAIGTTTASKSVKIFAGGVTSSNIVANISNTGVAVTGNISATGNITAANFTGNISITGNVTGTSANVQLVAGSYTSTFDNTGNVSLPGNLTVTNNVIITNLPAFRVYGSSSANIAATTTLTTTHGVTIDFNQGSYYNNTTGIFTAPIAGIYQVNISGRNSGYAGGISQLAAVKNVATTATVQVMVEWGASSTMNHAGASTVVKLAANDTLCLRVLAGNVQFDANDTWSVAFLG